MNYIIWVFVGVFYLWLGLLGRKEHKKLDEKLKKEPKSVKFTEYLVSGFWPLLLLFSIFVFISLTIKIIF